MHFSLQTQERRHSREAGRVACASECGLNCGSNPFWSGLRPRADASQAAGNVIMLCFAASDGV